MEISHLLTFFAFFCFLDIDYCLHFYFYINGSGPLLQVSHLNSANLEETLYYYNTNTYGFWYQVKVPFHGRANDMLVSMS